MIRSEGTIGDRASWTETPGLANLLTITVGAVCFKRLSIIPDCRGLENNVSDGSPARSIACANDACCLSRLANVGGYGVGSRRVKSVSENSN